MIKEIKISEFARHKQCHWSNHGQINLIIGENDSGKTQLLKLLYAIAKSLNSHAKKAKTTNEPWSNILAKKLLWTFQPDNFELGRLVNRSTKEAFKAEFTIQDQQYQFGFGKTTTKSIRDCSEPISNSSDVNAIYIPPKEVLSALDAIDATRKKLEIPGFDDTYIDLIDDLRLPATEGGIDKNLVAALKHLQDATGGGDIKLENGEFFFTRGREKYGMRSIAEGIRKISILNQLIRNRTLKNGSVLFIDEPETNLHPRAIILLVEMLFLIAKSGVQIYLATHSEFLLKRFEQLARTEQTANFVQLLSLTSASDSKKRQLTYSKSDLLDGLPENPIMEQSLDLYHKDVELDLI